MHCGVDCIVMSNFLKCSSYLDYFKSASSTCCYNCRLECRQWNCTEKVIDEN